MQLVVGQDQVPQVHQPLEVRVVQDGEAVGVQVEGVEVLQVGEGVGSDLADGVPAQGQVDLHQQTQDHNQRKQEPVWTGAGSAKMLSKMKYW